MAFEVLVERHAIATADPRCARAPRAPSRSAIFSSTMPAPARIVSAACASGVSPSASAAAMPRLRPEARRAFAEMRAAETTVTGERRKLERGEQAGEAGADHDHAAVACVRWRTGCVAVIGHAPDAYARDSMVEVDHALDGRTRPVGDRGIDRDLLFEEHEASRGSSAA